MYKPNNMDEYIAGFPAEVQELLQQIREAIKNVVPHAEEVMSYEMPAFRLNGILVWFAAYKNHIGFYPHSSGIEVFKKELSGYRGAKVQCNFR